MLVEQTQTRVGASPLLLSPFEGGRCTWGFRRSSPIACRNARRHLQLAFNDTVSRCVALSASSLLPLLKAGLLSTENLLEDMLASLNAPSLSEAPVREIARVAGLVFQGYPGQPKTNRQVQATSGLLYEVFARWDPANPLLGQAEREVLERQLNSRGSRKGCGGWRRLPW
jgi:ATP-dependent Lhr-like helicase